MQTTPIDPTDVWEQIILAKGGRERLHRVHTLVIRSTNMVPAGDARYRRVVGTVQYEFVRRFPDRFWAWEDYRPGAMGFATVVMNGERQAEWESNRGGPPKVVPWSSSSDRFLRRLLTKDQLIYLLETASVRPNLHRITQERGVLVLTGTAPGFAGVRYVIDPKTMLPKSITLTPDPVTIAGKSEPLPVPPDTYELDRYVLIDGIQMPTRTGLGDVEYVINPDLDQKLFETPPDRVTSRDEWRKFLKKE